LQTADVGGGTKKYPDSGPVQILAAQLARSLSRSSSAVRTHDERLRLLREEGVTEDRLARLRSPIGLDLGARTPEEAAVSITAEIIAQANQSTGRPLTRITGR
jgi:xanthine dehydrogenase accessory factor